MKFSTISLKTSTSFKLKNHGQTELKVEIKPFSSLKNGITAKNLTTLTQDLINITYGEM